MRRDASVLEMFERYKRNDDEHPNKKLVEELKGKERIKKKSILHVAKNLKEKHHLPENRKPEELHSTDLPPNLELLSAQVKTSLVEDVTKKNTEKHELYIIGHQTINTYPSDSIHVFTDGSAFKGTVNAGFGVRIEFPSG